MAVVEQYIEDVLEDIVGEITYDGSEVHFDHGNYIELANKLSLKKLNSAKFPLFALIQDVTERETDEDGIYKIYDFNMIIAYRTENNYTSQQRLTNIFKLILQPLYRQLLDEMKASNMFKFDKDYIEHTKINRYFLGSESPNQNRLNDCVDAIEINFKNVKLYIQSNC